ncbi:hypothetical protein V6N13_062838 [Hibiscus sabdariffa]
MNNLEESKADNNPRHQQEEEMAASSAAIDGIAASALRSVLQRVHQAAERCGRESQRIRVPSPSFVKSTTPLPDDIEWHFIGNLQSNKVKPLIAGVPNLAMVETVDDEKKAFKSLSPAKSGVEPSGCVELVKHVSLNCPNLQFCGLMTIGMPDYTSTPENFKTLANCRSEVCKALGIPEEQCELSMGMSGDFELGCVSEIRIEMGSTNVRVGSTIFGAREYPKKN